MLFFKKKKNNNEKKKSFGMVELMIIGLEYTRFPVSWKQNHGRSLKDDYAPKLIFLLRLGSINKGITDSTKTEKKKM